MARPASAVKGGYYPLPDSVTASIISHISSPNGGRILDPCAGKGIALATIATALNLEAYGVELNQARALDATTQIQALANNQDMPFCDHHPNRFIQGDYPAGNRQGRLPFALSEPTPLFRLGYQQVGVQVTARLPRTASHKQISVLFPIFNTGYR